MHNSGLPSVLVLGFFRNLSKHLKFCLYLCGYVPDQRTEQQVCDNRKRDNLCPKRIIKDNLIICLSCILTFSIGLFILMPKIGSPAALQRNRNQ